MKTRIKDLNVEFSKNRVLENQLRESWNKILKMFRSD